ncbi:MAG: Folylpolyglutamate synthase/dihydrofolate synthase [Acidobacteria bacterium]|nr:Folylpolyglutamate synthase/dihydrofolate synthase [Acidobacteriota bacterium]
MQFDEALRYLLSLGHETLALKLGLKTTEVLLQALQDPQTHFPSVQIAGTNGKGSTAAVLESIARAAGIKTGLFTSPHLVHITERIRIDGRHISEREFAELATTVRNTVEQLLADGQLTAPPTFFEQITAIALLAFKQANIELAILETGLGGRLDSTTVAEAQTVGITSIALDHQEYLGDTLAEIAAEKAAIIRPGVTAVIAPQAPAALEVILNRSASVGVHPRINGSDARLQRVTGDGRMVVTFATAYDCYEEVVFGLRGRHQFSNVSLAVQLAESLRERGFQISREAIINGVEGAQHPGRLELIDGRPQLLFDGAHNPAGALALREYLDEFVTGPVTMVFGAMREKNLEEMAGSLFPRAHSLILTRPENPRAAALETLQRIARNTLDQERITLEPLAGKAIDIALQQTPPDGLICVTGSLYLIGEIQTALKHSEFGPFAKSQRSH